MRFVFSICGAGSCIATTSALALPQSIGLDRLTEQVATARAEIEDIEVAYVFAAIDAPPAAVVREEGLMAMQGQRFIIETRFGDDDDLWLAEMASFDGNAAWGILAQARMAYTTASGAQRLREHGVDLSGGAFLRLLRWYPFLADGNSAPSADILERLKSAHAVVRSEMDEYDGRACHVVDWIHPRSGLAHETIWFDPSRGFLPVLQQRFTTFGEGSREPFAEIRVLDAVQVTEHSWVPTSAETTGSPNSRGDETSTGFDYLFTVKTDDAGNPILRVNSNLPVERFDCSVNLPAGTQVMNLDTDEYWIAGITDFKGMAETAIVAVPTAVGLEPAKSSGMMDSPATTPAWRNPIWFGSMGAAALASIAMFLMRRFR